MSATIAVLAENTLQTLNRVVSVLRGRAFHILSVTPGRTKSPSVTAITVVVDSVRTKPDRVVACLAKLDEVLQVDDVAAERLISRELVLLKVVKSTSSSEAIDALRTAAGARLLHETEYDVTMEFVGDPEAVRNALALVDKESVAELVRVGPVAITKSLSTPQ